MTATAAPLFFAVGVAAWIEQKPAVKLCRPAS